MMATLLVSCSRVNPEDISVEATLKVNESERMYDRDYVLEISIDKEHGKTVIYPYMKNLTNMTFDEEEDDTYFNPEVIGTNLEDEEFVLNELKKHNVSIDAFEFSSLIGFHIPEEKGEYKLRIYFEKKDDFESSDELYLIFLHKEDFNRWSKLIKVESLVD